MDSEAAEEEMPFTFQQHWIGARDYVSSDEEADVEGSADTTKAGLDSSQANLEVTSNMLQWQM